MVIGRRVARRKGQQLVALPPEVRDRLGVIPGQWLYFHLGRKGECVISTSPHRAGGQPPTASLERDLQAARARVAYLEKRIEGGSLATLREGAAQGVLQALRAMDYPGGTLFEIGRALDDIRAALGLSPRRRRARRVRAPARAVETAPAPVLAAPVEEAAPVPETEESPALL